MRLRSLNMSSAAMLFASTLIVNTGNYLINLLLGRFLGPAAFSEASAIATLVLVMSFIAVGIQLATAKFVAEDSQENNVAKIYSWFSTKTFSVSLKLSFLLIILSPWIKSYLQLDSVVPLQALFIGMPLFFGLAVKRGYYQGLDKMKTLSMTYLSEMGLRLIVTSVLVFAALSILDA